jgi:hypothetical protein
MLESCIRGGFEGSGECTGGMKGILSPEISRALSRLPAGCWRSSRSRSARTMQDRSPGGGEVVVDQQVVVVAVVGHLPARLVQALADDAVVVLAAAG